MESSGPNSNISMFPNRLTLDTLVSELSSHQETVDSSTDYLEAVIGLINNHPDASPAHYAAILPAIENALNRLNISSLGPLHYPNIEHALTLIENEHQAESLHRAFFRGSSSSD